MTRYCLVLSLIGALCPFTTWAYAFKEPLVETNYGLVRGSSRYSRFQRVYHSFRGIPYAKPPIGQLRFRAPEFPEPWEIPLDATKEGPYCIQKNNFFDKPQVEGNEDCLYLNIYVPVVNPVPPLPVMVFFHWGGFFSGRGTSDYLGPEYFMDKNVIVVTFNYRLGVMGFLSTLDDEAPGNFGFKDQVMALRFVQDNIKFFGGDENRVTIFGQSAGSGSVSLHLLSRSSRGLFQQAITQSGVELNLWAKPRNDVQATVLGAQAVFVNCSQFMGNNKDLVNCLRNVSAHDLVRSGDNFKYFSIEPLTPFTTVIEKKSRANPEPFLTDEPLNYLQNGDFERVPWIVGTTSDEGILRVAPLLRQQDTRKTLNSNFTSLIPQMLALELSAGDNADSLLKNMSDFYLGGKFSVDINDPKSVQGLIDLYTDRSFLYGTYQSIMQHSYRGHTPIWLYHFNYKGQYTYGDLFAATNQDINFDWGVSHCDDLIYLFNSPALLPSIEVGTDLCMSIKLVNLWTDFAIYGDPDPLKEIGWDRLMLAEPRDFKNENLSFLNITGSVGSKTIHLAIQTGGFFKDRIKFWEDQDVTENFRLF